MYDIAELRDRVLVRFDVESFCDFLGITLEELFNEVVYETLGPCDWQEKLEKELYDERGSAVQDEE